MNLLNYMIKCASCKETLKLPVVLPCGHSICKHHVDQVTNNTREKKIDCENCSKSYSIPVDGFAPNRNLEIALELDINEIDEENFKAMEKCARFSELLDEFNRMKNDPEMRIHTVLSDLRNKVDLRREVLKHEIDKEAMKTMEKIDEYEKECKVSSIKTDTRLENKIKRWKTKLEQSQQSLNTVKGNTDKWNEVLREQVKKLQSEFIKMNDNLFLNRLDKFMNSHFFDLSDCYTIT